MCYRIKQGFSQTIKRDRLQWYLHYPLYLCSMLYGGVIKGRIFLYRTGMLRGRRLPRRVISIGNLTVGGSGKTPMAIFIAKRLASMGKKCAVISRGYGGTYKGPVSVVSDGVTTLMTAGEAGDEPVLIAQKTKGVPVLISRDRYSAGRHAIERFNSEYLILDDGFQHLRLERDINILMMVPAGGGADTYLLPRGILREPASAINRADLLLVKGTRTTEEACRHNVPLFHFNYRLTGLISLYGNSDKGISALKGKRVVLLSGIANPESFSMSIGKTGAEIILHLSYPDHHRFCTNDIESINRRLHPRERDIDMVVTTEKDMVRLQCVKRINLDTYALAIEVDIDGSKEFERLIF